jgi:chemotaxis protein methyltransferase CheR
VGKPVDGAAAAKSGLGTSIVQALAKELDARVDIASGHNGTTVFVRHSPMAKAV